jgi:hypothetical protein
MKSLNFYKSVCLSIVLATANFASAQQAGTFPWEGEITAANVYVRSGAGSNWYPTMKVNTGDHVLVLGEKFGWYQIAPPAGSFSFVDIASIDRKAGEKTGTVKSERVYVRAGSALETRKSATQVVLNKGAKVEIEGEADGFFRIKPPAGAALYISKQYAKPIDPKLSTGLVEKHISTEPVATKETNPPANEVKIPEPQQPAFAAAPTPAGTEPAPMTGDASSQPDATQLASATPTVDPATKSDALLETESIDKSKPPAATDAAKKDTKKSDEKLAARTPVPAAPQVDPAGRYRVQLAVLETELVAMLRKPIGEQEYESLRKRYEPIAKQKDEQVSSEVAKIRLRQLRDREELRDARTKLVSDSREIDAYRANMDQERAKIQSRRMDKALERYELEGELRRSLAFAPENHRYRLVDRTTQATIAYVDIAPSIVPNAEHLVGRFVGIHTAGQRFSPSARVPIAVAAEVVDLSLRLQSSEDLPPADSSNSQPPQVQPEVEPLPEATTPSTATRVPQTSDDQN